MVSGLPPPQAELRERRWAYRVGAGVLLLAGLDELRLPNAPELLASRLVATLALLLLAELHLRSARLAPWLGVLGGPPVLAWSVFQTWLQGGSAAPAAFFLPALPLAVMVLLQSDVRAVALSSATMLAAVLALLGAEAAPAAAFAQWATILLVMGGLATLASVHVRRVERLRAAAELARRLAIEAGHQAHAELAAERTAAQQKERLVLVGQLAAGVAHEVNNPLAVVKADLELLASDTTSQHAGLSHAEYVELLREASSAVERIRLVVVGLKAFARGGEGGTRRTVMTDVIERSLALAQVRVKPPVVLSRDVPQALPELELDGERMVQTLVSLVLNAVHALEEAPHGPSPRIEVRARALDGHLDIEVEDNGPGFPKHLLATPFVPFKTTKREGRGLGLSLAMATDFVASLGGTLVAENRASGGARVRIQLPVVG